MPFTGNAAHIEQRLRRSSEAIMNDPDEQQRLRELSPDMDICVRGDIYRLNHRKPLT